MINYKAINQIINKKIWRLVEKLIVGTVRTDSSMSPAMEFSHQS